tara:strand:+ start:3221 stop:4006 length:786 start_codon:yes stop_codon:yes gene_type:complete
MKCLITGTDGFVGKNLLKRLIKDGHYADKLSVKFDDFDYSEDLNKRVKDCDVIFHIGAISDVNLQDYNKMLKYNFYFSKILFDLAKKYNKQVVYSSSSAVYGNGELPENIYAWSKYLAEQYGLQTVEKFVALRYFNVFGPGEEHKDNMQSLILRIYSSKVFGIFPVNPSRDFIYVEDVVNANLKALDSPSGVYDCGSGNSYKYEELCDEIGVKYYYTDKYDVPSGYQSYTKADKNKFLPNWKPQFTIQEGIKKYLNYLEKK